MLFISLFLYSLKSFAAPIYILEDKQRSYSPEDALRLVQKGQGKPLIQNRYNAGLTGSVFWLVFKARPEISDHRIIVGNAHINKLDFYIADQKPKLKYQTGDYYPFEQRPVNNRLFVFPLEANTGAYYLIRVDKHNESLQLSTEILSAEEFYQQSANENLINGLLWGVILLIVIFGCFLYFTVRENLYLYYVLFILSASMWLIADKGYGYQFLWPDFPTFASRARPVFNALVTAAALQFMQSFIGQRQGRVYRIVNFVKLISILLALLFLFVPYNYHDIVYGFLILLLVLSASPSVLIPLSLYPKIREGNQPARFYLASIFMLIVFSVIELMVHGGGSGSAINYLSNYGIQTGLIVDVVILNFGLAHRFNSYKNEKEKLLLDMNRRQNELTERIIETQESERKKISDQLHDDIGSMLSLATLQISSIAGSQQTTESEAKLEKAIEVLGSVSNGIRNMSHSLSPLAIEKYGFKNALLDLIKTINLARQIHVEHIIMGMDDSERFDRNFLNDLYRIIKEVLNNVIKHSGASNCLIQIIEYEDNVSVMVEDNGKGISISEQDSTNGIGLLNVKSKIEYFEGHIEISNMTDAGTLVNIQLPLRIRRYD